MNRGERYTMNKTTVAFDVRRKIKAGHTVFDKPTVLALLAEIDRLQALLTQPALPLDETAKQIADKLLKEARDIFDGELSLCDDANTPEWIWKWKVRYYFEDTDIPPHTLPDEIIGETEPS